MDKKWYHRCPQCKDSVNIVMSDEEASVSDMNYVQLWHCIDCGCEWDVSYRLCSCKLFNVNKGR